MRDRTGPDASAGPSSDGASRRCVVLAGLACACAGATASSHPPAWNRRWIDAAEAMRAQALSWGDQAYGAVLVKGDRIIGYGPSRVVKTGNPDAHAEREAIKHALAEAGADAVKGAVLYSTSRPCRACEVAAAQAGVRRMYFGPEGHDAGSPTGR